MLVRQWTWKIHSYLLVFSYYVNRENSLIREKKDIQDREQQDTQDNVNEDNVKTSTEKVNKTQREEKQEIQDNVYHTVLSETARKNIQN